MTTNEQRGEEEGVDILPFPAIAVVLQMEKKKRKPLRDWFSLSFSHTRKLYLFRKEREEMQYFMDTYILRGEVSGATSHRVRVSLFLY